MSLVRPLLLWITLSAPLLCLLAIVLLACGGTEHAVFAVMRASRDAHPTLTTFLNGVSYWTNLLFYAWFAWLLLRALITGDRATRR
ncbi:MAG: hypothetical protein KKB70_11100, partial [Proteobacteria bacterium]|nr:hypothetical protein [Pseudomonadota bacterium]